MKSKFQAQPRLTLKTAKAIIQKETDLPVARLKQREDCAGAYEVEMGYFRITVQNDFSGSGNIALIIRHCTGGQIRKLFNPATFEEDYATEDKQRIEDIEEIICDYGPERCRAILERGGVAL